MCVCVSRAWFTYFCFVVASIIIAVVVVVVDSFSELSCAEFVFGVCVCVFHIFILPSVNGL